MKIIRKYGYKHLVFWVLFVFVFNFVFFPVSILAKENSGLETEVFLPGITKNEISEAENFELEVILDEDFKHLPENPNRPWEVVDTLHIPVTAYNAGDINQCWGDPCISANGENICLALEKGYRRCAANFVPLGTRLNIEGFGDCLVTDRMNERYHYRVDIAMKLDEKQKAKEFGIKKLKVEIVK